MITSSLKFILSLPKYTRQALCLHDWEYLLTSPSDWHSLCECRKCGKTIEKFN